MHTPFAAITFHPLSSMLLGTVLTPLLSRAEQKISMYIASLPPPSPLLLAPSSSSPTLPLYIRGEVTPVQNFRSLISYFSSVANTSYVHPGANRAVDSPYLFILLNFSSPSLSPSSHLLSSLSSWLFHLLAD